MKEIWKPLKYKNVKKDLYLISNTGKIKNKNTNKILKGGLTEKGYRQVCLSINKDDGTTSQASFRIHRIVAKNFKLFKPKGKDTINHIDGNKLNNCIDNLEWANQSEQIRHAYDNKLIRKRKGPELYNNIYNEELIIKICEIIDLGITKPKHISKYLNIEHNRKLIYLISDIKKGHSWNYISKNYKWFNE